MNIKDEIISVFKFALNVGKIKIGHAYYFMDDGSPKNERILSIPIEVYSGMVKTKTYSVKYKENLGVRMISARTFRAFYKLNK